MDIPSDANTSFTQDSHKRLSILFISKDRFKVISSIHHMIVSDQLKPASRDRFKTGHFEGVGRRSLTRDLAVYEYTQNGYKTFDTSTFGTWLVSAEDRSCTWD